MIAGAGLVLLAVPSALLALLYLVTTARPDPTRAIHAAPERPRKPDRDPHRRRRRRSRGIEI